MCLEKINKENNSFTTYDDFNIFYSTVYLCGAVKSVLHLIITTFYYQLQIKKKKSTSSNEVVLYVKNRNYKSIRKKNGFWYFKIVPINYVNNFLHCGTQKPTS